MAQVTQNLGLTVWNNLSDPYDSSQLVDNFVKIDLHDHSGTANKGAQLDGATSILPGSISYNQLGTNSVTSTKLANDPTSDSNRAVNTDHVKNGAITKEKLNQTTTGKYVLPKVINAGNPLPTTVTEGDEVYYKISGSSVGADNNAIWHLRYNGTDWDFLGGGAISTVQSTAASTTAAGGTWELPSSNAVANTLPLHGKYAIHYSSTAKYASEAAHVYTYATAPLIGSAVSGGTIPSDSAVYATQSDASSSTPAGSNYATASGVYTLNLTGSTSSLIVKLVYNRIDGAGTLNIPGQIMHITPISNLSNSGV